MMENGMMDGMGGMIGFMGGGMLLVAAVLIGIGFAIGYAVAKRRQQERDKIKRFCVVKTK